MHCSQALKVVQADRMGGGPWRKEGFPGSSAGKESIYSVGDLGSIPGLGRSTGEGISYPLQYSSLENSMDCVVHGVTKSQTRLSDFHFLEKEKQARLS